LKALGGFNKQWSMFKDQMAKVDRALDSSRRAYTDLMDTRTRQLDRQVERVDALRLTAGLDESDETLTSDETRALAPPSSSDEEAPADRL
jgi:DNA anti-recombination protein RmuC